jgi:hypothetical protein
MTVHLTQGFERTVGQIDRTGRAVGAEYAGRVTSEYRVGQARNLVHVDRSKIPVTPRPVLTDSDLERMSLDQLRDLAIAESRTPGLTRRK